MKYIITALVLMSINFAYAHNARVDKNGGHNCSQKSKDKGVCDGYHYHNKSEPKKEESKQVSSSEYDRSSWPHWTDDDRDCQDARSETLIRDSLIAVKFKRNKGCNVSWGKWLVPYKNIIIEKASATDIDHIVPLGHAHFYGAQNWTRAQKRAFANDPENLLVTSASANRSKSDRSPDEWMPPYKPYHCTYIKKWVHVKLKYNLSFGKKEKEFIISKGCEL